jgi:hypothetical protein
MNRIFYNIYDMPSVNRWLMLWSMTIVIACIMQFSERPVLLGQGTAALVDDDNALLTYTHPFIDVSVTSNIIYDEDGAYYLVQARVCVHQE